MSQLKVTAIMLLHAAVICAMVALIDRVFGFESSVGGFAFVIAVIAYGRSLGEERR